jgi:hypothetical protein
MKGKKVVVMRGWWEEEGPVGIFSILSSVFCPSITCPKIVYFPRKIHGGENISADREAASKEEWRRMLKKPQGLPEQSSHDEIQHRNCVLYSTSQSFLHDFPSSAELPCLYCRQPPSPLC